MNNASQEQQELDAFFNNLLPKLPKRTRTLVPAPSQELLDSAWEVAKAQYDYLWRNGLYHETILPQAASDGSHRNKPITFTCQDGRCTLTFEKDPDNEQEQILSFKCPEDLIESFKGLKIVVRIDAIDYDLGEVDWSGIAETRVPTAIYIKELPIFYKKSEE